MKQSLIEGGVKEENITAMGFGSENPVASNKTKEGRALNRRVEIELEAK